MRPAQRQAVLQWARDLMRSSQHPLNLGSRNHTRDDSDPPIRILRRLALYDLHAGPLHGDSLTAYEQAVWAGFTKACRVLGEWARDEVPDLYLDDDDCVQLSSRAECSQCGGGLGLGEDLDATDPCETCGGSGEVEDAPWLTCVPASQVRRILFGELAEYI